MSNLVIVESAAKAKTISKYLNSIPELADKGRFNVVASLGHITDLPLKELGVNKETWAVSYSLNKTKAALLKKIKTLAKEAIDSGHKVYLASDMDLEGHAIAEHLRSYLKLNKRSQYERVLFNEITKQALKTAFMNPLDIDMDAVAAQESRRVLDRLVGYELSPLLWSTFNSSKLSAGRVQSAALNMIVMKNKEIDEHVPETYWKAEGTFQSNNISEPLSAMSKTTFATLEDAQTSLQQLTTIPIWTAEFSKSITHKNPMAPFTTSTLQQECFKRYGIPAKSTMKIAQALYEAGFITYMRTDSPCLSKDAQTNIMTYIETTFNKSEVQPRVFQSKGNAQEAHEAIRPSTVTISALPTDKEGFTASHQKVYELIWRRTVASQMSPAQYTDISYVITSANTQIQFHGKTSILTKEGYLKIYSPELKANTAALDIWEHISEKQKKTEQVTAKTFEMKGDISRAKPYYNEAMFVKAMETEGIGRPSTYSSVVDKLYDKGYVVKGSKKELSMELTTLKGNVGKPLKSIVTTLKIPTEDKDSMIVTDIGKEVIKYISTVAPYMIDPTFTKLMESDLDKISNRETTKKKILDDFYNIFGSSIAEAQGEAKAKKAQSANQSKTPSAPIVDFPILNASLMNTRYGPALYEKTKKAFHTITPLLEWRQKNAEAFDQNDAEFILSLPRPIPGTTATLMIGRYGLYLKQASKNIRLATKLWDKAYDGTLTQDDIAANPVEYTPARKTNQNSH